MIVVSSFEMMTFRCHSGTRGTWDGLGRMEAGKVKTQPAKVTPGLCPEEATLVDPEALMGVGS
ncbi:MAG: hypothetical protein H6831_01240 [Planctomycetes bacterium]|nr:hypothetical protein [Planctomycetota bacterium]